MYKVTLNSQSVYNVEIEGKTIRINDKSISPDQIKIEKNYFHILYNGKSYHIIVDGHSDNYKKLDLVINGCKTSVNIQDDLDIVLEKTGLDRNNALTLKSLKAPMPGKITKIYIEENQSVAQNDALLILNAMKMENILKAKGEGVVGKLLVEEGENVEKDQELIQFL